MIFIQRDLVIKIEGKIFLNTSHYIWMIVLTVPMKHRNSKPLFTSYLIISFTTCSLICPCNGLVGKKISTRKWLCCWIVKNIENLEKIIKNVFSKNHIYGLFATWYEWPLVGAIPVPCYNLDLFCIRYGIPYFVMWGFGYAHGYSIFCFSHSVFHSLLL